jgi:hypothetical protein
MVSWSRTANHKPRRGAERSGLRSKTISERFPAATRAGGTYWIFRKTITERFPPAKPKKESHLLDFPKIISERFPVASPISPGSLGPLGDSFARELHELRRDARQSPRIVCLKPDAVNRPRRQISRLLEGHCRPRKRHNGRRRQSRRLPSPTAVGDRISAKLGTNEVHKSLAAVPLSQQQSSQQQSSRCRVFGTALHYGRKPASVPGFGP